MTKNYNLLSLVNRDNQSQLTENDVSFSLPIEDIGATWNTKVTISSIPGSGYTGSVDVKYTRPNLLELDNNSNGGLYLLSEYPFLIDDILNRINLLLKVDLDLSDIDPVVLPVMEIGDISTLNLRASPDSMEWTGDVDVSLVLGLPSNTDILHTLLNNVFPSSGYLI